MSVARSTTLRLVRTVSSGAQLRQGLSAPVARCRPEPLRSTSLRFRPTPLESVRWRSSITTGTGSKIYEFAQVQEISNSPSEDRILIDVREPAEYEAGYIPTAINLPVKSSPEALFLPAEEFEEKFGFKKPSADAEVIFYCKSGVRSNAAALLAHQCGYKNVSEYKGSWLDWSKNGGSAAKP